MPRAAALPKADRAVIAAHEAGMHDAKPKPESCRACAQEAAPPPVSLPEVVATAIKSGTLKRRVRKPAPEKPAVVPVPPLVITDGADEVIDLRGVEAVNALLDLLPDTLAPILPPLAGSVWITEPAVYTQHTREGWLLRAVDMMRPAFAEAGFPIPERVRVSVGWPGGRGKKKGVIGQCWPPALSGDGLSHIFVSPVLTKTADVLETLSHELVHASVPKGSSHRGPFVKLARKLGHVAPWTATTAGPELAARLEVIAEELGEYDHGGLSQIGRAAVQTTRMLKVECEDCGCVIRMTRKWLNDAGAPTCGCGGEMKEATA